jgi:hypothetical protein
MDAAILACDPLTWEGWCLVRVSDGSVVGELDPTGSAYGAKAGNMSMPHPTTMVEAQKWLMTVLGRPLVLTATTLERLRPTPILTERDTFDASLMRNSDQVRVEKE